MEDGRWKWEMGNGRWGVERLEVRRWRWIEGKWRKRKRKREIWKGKATDARNRAETKQARSHPGGRMGNQNIEDPGDGEKEEVEKEKGVEDPGWPLVPICEYDGSSGYSTQGNLFGGGKEKKKSVSLSDCFLRSSWIMPSGFREETMTDILSVGGHGKGIWGGGDGKKIEMNHPKRYG